MKTTAMKLSLLLAFALLAASSALAWDHGGHMIVAKLAYDRLTPAEQQKLGQALAGLDRTGKSYNGVTAACWMDDVRGNANLYQDWHFVTEPYVKTTPLPLGENAVWAYNYAKDVFLGKKQGNAHLAGKDAKYVAAHPPISKAEALAMMMHLAGDLHQPLHCTNHPFTDSKGKQHDEDRGGNDIAILDAPKVGGLHGPMAMKLHHFWDAAYRDSFVGNQVKEGSEWSRPSAPDSAAFGKKVHELIDGSATTFLSQSTAAGWLADSHRIGMQAGYEPLGADLGKESITLSETYVNAANTIARQRMARAGIRLARELKAVLKH